MHATLCEFLPAKYSITLLFIKRNLFQQFSFINNFSIKNKCLYRRNEAHFRQEIGSRFQIQCLCFNQECNWENTGLGRGLFCSFKIEKKTPWISKVLVFYDQRKDSYSKYLGERLGEEKRQRQRKPEPFILFD